MDETRVPSGATDEGKIADSRRPKEASESRFFATVETAFRHLEKPLKTPISSTVYELRLCAGRAPFFMAQLNLISALPRAA
jgi:hypothetical protein